MTVLPAGPVRLIASDVDGTLLTRDHLITPAVRAAVAQARTAGVPVVLASARGPLAMKHLLADLGTVNDWPFIAFQGALVGRYDASGTLHTVHETRLDLETARAIVRRALAADSTVNWYDTESWFVSRWDRFGEWEAHATQVTVTGTIGADQLDSAHAQGPHKLMIPPDPARPALVPELAAALPPGAVPHLSGEGYLEITAPGADKSHALAGLCEQLGIPLGAAAAIGDGPNDIGMFDLVGTAVAMGNASPAVRSRADFVTVTNEEDGMAVAVRAVLAGPPGRLFPA